MPRLPGTVPSLALVLTVSVGVSVLVSYRGMTPIWLFNQGESGVWLDEAAAVLDGQVMYRDFFEFVAPGVVYADALMLSIVGRSAFAAQLIPVFVGAILAVLVWRISRKVLDGVWTLVPPLTFACLVYPRYNPGNHKWLAWMATLAAMDVLIAHRQSVSRVAIAGVLAGTAIVCTQDLGTQAALGLLVALWPGASWRTRSAFVAGVVAVPFVVLGYFVARAGVDTMWYDLIVFPTTQYRNANGGFDLAPFYSLSRLPLIVLQWVTPIAAAGAGIVAISPALQRRLRIGFAGGAWPIVVWPGLIVVLVESVTRVLEPTQTIVRSLPLLIALVGLLQALALRFPVGARTIAAALVASAAMVSLVTIGSRQTRPMTLVNTRAGAIWSLAPLPEAEWLQTRTREGESVFLLPDKGGLFFLTRTRNATMYPYLQDMDFSSPRQVRAAIDEISRTRPRVGLFDRSRLYSQGSIETSSLRPLYDYLAGQYDNDGRMYFALTRSEW